MSKKKTERPKIVVINEGGLWDDTPLETRKLIKFTLFAWVTGFICASILFTGGILH